MKTKTLFHTANRIPPNVKPLPRDGKAWAGRPFFGWVAVLALAALAFIPQLSATPLGTAFTYQGRLNDGGRPANGSYDLKFTLYDTGPGPVAGPLTNAPVAVSNGLFTVTLDFGTGVFAGDARWLEIGVRTNGTAADFTALTPRQALTPGPYALYAASSGTAAAAGTVPWSGLTGVPVGFADGADNDTTYSAGTGLSLAGTSFSLNTSFTDARYWKLAGNSGTTPGTHFVGTTDNQPLELWANGTRVFRVEATGSNSVNVLAGWRSNSIAAGVVGATIAGGGTGNYLGYVEPNVVVVDFGTIGGGYGNAVQSNAWESTVAGGYGNKIGIESLDCTISGGFGNCISNSSFQATIGGGAANTMGSNAYSATIGGGEQNTIMTNGYHGTIPGGRLNTAGRASFAAGYRAKAIHPGSFVWADYQEYSDFPTTGSNQFLIRATGGVGIGKNNPATALDVNGTVTASAFSGNGAGLASLDATNLGSGTVNDSRLSANVALLNASQTFSGIPAFNGGISGSSAPFSVDSTFVVANLNADLLDGQTGTYYQNAGNLTGTLSDSRLSSNVALRSGGNAFTGNQTVTSGSVGIGTTSPQSPLHIHQTSGNSSIRLTSGASWPLTINQSDTSICIISNVNKPVLTLAGANVGIGTASPATLLDVESTSGGFVQVDGGNNQNSGFAIMETNGGRWTLFFRGWESDNLIVRDEPGGHDSMTFQSGTGFVGVGTGSPTCPLDVNGSGNINYSYGYLSSSGTVGTASGNNAYSIRASSRICATEFNAYSDRRSKEVTGRSKTSDDLETIRRLQVTDYRYIDTVANGSEIKKGFIAQEVEQVIPEAVTSSPNFIPSLFCLATRAEFNAGLKTLTLTLPKPHELAVGDKVRLYIGEEMIERPVTLIPSEMEFVVCDWNRPVERVFVYGRCVSDYKTLDYDRLFTTGIGAIQELAKQLEAKESRMAQMEREMAELKTVVNALARQHNKAEE